MGWNGWRSEEDLGKVVRSEWNGMEWNSESWSAEVDYSMRGNQVKKHGVRRLEPDWDWNYTERLQHPRSHHIHITSH